MSSEQQEVGNHDAEFRIESPVFTLTADEVRKHFPTYTTIDRSKWDNYVPDPHPSEDLYKVLGFSEGERSSTTPELRVLFKKPDGTRFTINMANNPHRFGSETHIATPAITVYAKYGYGDGGNWSVEEMDMAVAATKMFQEGIRLTPDVVDAPAFIMPDNRIATLREIIGGARDMKAAVKKPTPALDEALKAQFHPLNIHKVFQDDPERVRELIVERLKYRIENSLPFSFDGQERDASEILNEVTNRTEIGDKVMQLEMLQTGVYLELLWEQSFIRGGKAEEVILPE